MLGARAYILQGPERVEDARGDRAQGVVVEMQAPVRHKKARYQRMFSLSHHMPMDATMRMCIGKHPYPHYEYVHVIFKGYMSRYILHVSRKRERESEREKRQKMKRESSLRYYIFL